MSALLAWAPLSVAVVAAWIALGGSDSTRVDVTEALLASAAEETLAFYDEHGYLPADSATPLGEDPWGHAIKYYRVPSGGFVLVSLGSDGMRGGNGDAADLVVVRLVQEP